MQKRGLSNIVAVVLLILIAIAAIVLLWLLIKTSVQESGEELEFLANCFGIELEPRRCTYSEFTNALGNYLTEVVVSRNDGKEGLIRGLHFVYQNQEQSIIFQNFTAMRPYDSIAFYHEAGFTPTKVTPAAIISNDRVCTISLLEKNCKQADCGNLQIEIGEICDDGNNINLDRCPNDCIPDCADGMDNDGDTIIDFPNDRQCHAYEDDETPSWLRINFLEPPGDNGVISFPASLNLAITIQNETGSETDPTTNRKIETCFFYWKSLVDSNINSGRNITIAECNNSFTGRVENNLLILNTFEGQIDLPEDAVPGNYRVTAYALDQTGDLASNSYVFNVRDVALLIRTPEFGDRFETNPIIVTFEANFDPTSCSYSVDSGVTNYSIPICGDSNVGQIDFNFIVTEQKFYNLTVYAIHPQDGSIHRADSLFVADSCPGDVDRSREVNVFDLAYLLSSYNMPSNINACYTPGMLYCYDIAPRSFNLVDSRDIDLFSQFFGNIYNNVDCRGQFI